MLHDFIILTIYALTSTTASYLDWLLSFTDQSLSIKLYGKCYKYDFAIVNCTYINQNPKVPQMVIYSQRETTHEQVIEI